MLRNIPYMALMPAALSSNVPADGCRKGEYIMKRSIAVLLALCSLFAWIMAAQADTDIYHTPSKDQLSEKEAFKIAVDFFKEAAGVDISGEFCKEYYTALFGPGYQWYADTEDDCWVIRVDIGSDLPISAHAIVHGTTGEVLRWSFRDKETKISYQCALPEETMLTMEEAVAIVREQFAQALGLTAEEAQNTFCSTSFGLYGVMTVLENVETPDLPVWCVVIGGKYTQPYPLMGGYYVSAIDGAVIEASLEEDPEYRELHP